MLKLTIRNLDRNLRWKSESQTNFSNLQTWVKQNGGMCDHLEFTEFQNGRGISSKQEINQNDTVLFVPTNILFTLDLAKSCDLCIQLPQDQIFADSTYLALFLMQEIKKGSNSKWQPWLNTLPTEFDQFPMFYKPEDFEWLAQTGLLISTQGKIKALSNEFNLICASIPNLAESFSLREFQEAKHLVDSRDFSIMIKGKPTKVMVPFVDMLNHSQTPDVEFNFDQEKDGFVISAQGKIIAGQQMQSSYGSRCSGNWLLHYGFIFPNNPDNNLVFDLSLSGAQAEKVKSIGASSKLIHRCFLKPNYDNDQTKKFIAFLRFNQFDGSNEELSKLISETETTDHKFDGELEEAVSFKNEKRVHRAIINLFKQRISSYKTSIKHDQELLKQNLTLNQRNCVIYRIGEKEICEFFIKSSEIVLEIMEVGEEQATDEINELAPEFTSLKNYLNETVLPIIKSENQFFYM